MAGPPPLPPVDKYVRVGPPPLPPSIPPYSPHSSHSTPPLLPRCEKETDWEAISLSLGLSVKMIMEMREAFRAMDEDCSGELGVDELREVLSAVGHAPTDAELLDLMKEVDIDGNGNLDFDEFLELMSLKLKYCTPSDEIKESLSYFDSRESSLKPHTGFLTSENLQEMLIGLGFTALEVDQVLLWAKPDKDGLVNYGDFSDQILAMKEEDLLELEKCSEDAQEVQRGRVRTSSGRY